MTKEEIQRGNCDWGRAPRVVRDIRESRTGIHARYVPPERRTRSIRRSMSHPSRNDPHSAWYTDPPRSSLDEIDYVAHSRPRWKSPPVAPAQCSSIPSPWPANKLSQFRINAWVISGPQFQGIERIPSDPRPWRPRIWRRKTPMESLTYLGRHKEGYRRL